MAVASLPMPKSETVDLDGPVYNGREMSIDEFLAIPFDGVSRRLVDGIVIEEGIDVPYRNPVHSRVMTRVAFLLESWAEQLPGPIGVTHTGDVGAVFERNPRRIAVGIDVAFFSNAVLDRQLDTRRVVEGFPDLAVEILSPSDFQESVDDKIELYMEYRIPHLWVINTRFRSVTVYRPGVEPQLFVGDAILGAEPQLPGLAVKTSDLFYLVR